uniref:CS domain-containing protein n=1 Tax=Alexandrium andersonii TaxID=327968 RepID=A0A7S2AIG4_9DINO
MGEDCIECHFRRVGVLLLIRSGAKTHWWKAPNLCKEIDLQASKRNIKADQIVIKLRKRQTGEQWSDLTDEKDKYQKMREYRINHGDLKGATTEELLADMYQHANDEDRAGLRDAMRVNREKREEDTRKARDGS